MPVVGVNFTKIEGKTSNTVLELTQISVSSAPKIINVEKRELNVGSIKAVVEIDFEFNIKYEPDVGKIDMTGKVLYHCADPEKIVKMWKEKKELDKDMAVEVMNVIFRQSLTKAIVISNDLQLPAPIRFPVVQADEKKK